MIDSLITPLSAHHQYRKKFTHPFVHQMGSKLQFTQWPDNGLPEMLWIVLLFGLSDNRETAFSECSRILKGIHSSENRSDIGNINMTGISQMKSDVRQEFLGILTANGQLADVLSPMLWLESLPARDDWNKVLPSCSATEAEAYLQYAVAQSLYSNFDMTTDIRWMLLASLTLSGKVRFGPGAPRTADAVRKYPSNPEEYGSSIRAFSAFYQEKALSEHDWNMNFWDELFTKSKCIKELWEQDLDISAGSLTRAKIDEVQATLESHYSESLCSSAVDAKADAIFGLARYCLRIVDEMMGIGVSSGVLARLGVRSILEALLTSCFLESETGDVPYDEWRKYGLGQAKLVLEKWETDNHKPSFADIPVWEHVASEDGRAEFNPVDVGSWSGSNLRKVSENLSMKDDFYDAYYPYLSTYVHAQWPAVRESSFHVCANALHKAHRLLGRPQLTDALYDAAFLTDEVLKSVDRIYPEFSNRLIPNSS